MSTFDRNISSNESLVRKAKFYRMATSVLFIILVSVSLYSYKKIFSGSDLRNNPYPLIDISRNFIKQENFIINIQPLREKLNQIVNKYESDSVSLYFEFLNTGANVQINNELRVWPASLPKVPMAMVVMDKIEKGDWSLNTELRLMNEDKDLGYGDLWRLPTGVSLKIEDMLRVMLSKSDNTSYRVFLRSVRPEDLDGIISELGLEEVFADNGFVSAKEYSRIFRSLYVSSFLKRENSQKILEWLAQSDFRDFLASGVPENVLFAHKFGIEVSKFSYIDSGIVYIPGRPYLLTVAIQGDGNEGEEEDVKKIMREISEIVYEYISNVGVE